MRFRRCRIFHRAAAPAGRSDSTPRPTPRKSLRRLSAPVRFRCSRSNPTIRRCSARIEAPPPMVYVKGRRELLSRPAVAIVGSRQCSAAGVQVTRQFASELAEAGFVIVSGLARGIDRAAHEAALARGTVAVLAGGIDGFIRPSTPSFSAGSAAKAVSSRSGRRASNLEKRIFRGETGPLLAWCMASSSSKRQCHRERSSPPAMPTRTRGVRASRSSSRSARRRHRLIKSGATFVTAPEDIVEVLDPIIGLDEHRAD